ncbi:helix-turn-helix domain-containing protein [Rhodococcus sp. IEGM 1408]|uniref:TetR/AcrR family transcriptional regulator n=1 Tax=Rhodococcus sp. IEGM 1408 TaxID=3082220 RepID=UPI002954BEB2|nr:helix-turn-helix domain-containing protein [Rhodococcus sp. IEGM 1408]MDV7999941.1 helix-turn-helix domain-containing protein [Rhodococcus sp. IEGM 1408]
MALEPWPIVATTEVGERILVAADELFYARGITAVGVELIAEEAQTTKRTLYQRFGSKDGLVEAYLRRRGSRWQQYLVDHLDATGWTVTEFFRRAEQWAQSHHRGCAFVNAWAEVGGAGASAAAETIRDEKRWMRELLVTLTGGDRATAAAIHQLYEGAQVAATVLGEADAFRVADAAAGVVMGRAGR